MSTYMYVVTEEKYLQFLTEISDDTTFEEIYDNSMQSTTKLTFQVDCIDCMM